jgi:hypothetical protein
MNIEPEIILALITIAGNILLAIFQFRQTKANAKKQRPNQMFFC